MNALVIGGGFYGCMVALHLKSRGIEVEILERGDALCKRSSYVNQARVHNGYHYPRSFNTAYRSRFNAPRFIRDFKPAVVDNFKHFYGIVRGRSKVTAKQFATFCKNIEAPLKVAGPQQKKWFNPRLMEEVFEAEEFAFNASIIAEILEKKLAEAKIPVRFGSEVEKVEPGVVVTLKGGKTLKADKLFNCTYSALEQVLGEASLNLKHEITEIALVEMPPLLKQVGLTVMDGPFFSAMPFPAEKLHSFTHVRYTPHASWKGGEDLNPYKRLAEYPRESRYNFMVHDAARFMPHLAECRYDHSLFEVKTVMQANEVDDGRPILFKEHPAMPVYSILGSKIDNIFDVLERIDKVLAA